VVETRDSEPDSSQATTVRPAVDVVVPFAGSDAQLDALIARLGALALRDDDTLVIVDNRPAGAAARPRPGVVRAPDVQCSYHARNHGVRSGQAPWLVFIDADVLPPPDLVDRYFEHDVDDRTAVLAGGIRDVTPVNGTRIALRYARLARPDNDENVWRPGFEYAQTGNAAVRRAAFEAVGGFVEVRSGGDAELCFRLAEAGWGIERRRQALVEHHSRASMRALVRQHLRYGAGTEWLDARYPGLAPPRRGPPRVLVGSLRRGLTSATALARGDRDRAARDAVESVCSVAFELGRRLPNDPVPPRAVLVAKLRQALRRPAACRRP
jgi:mycofactocin glycosyltransferase